MPATHTYSAGTAFLTVVPSFLGIEKAFKEQVRAMAAAADKDLAAGMARGLKQANQQAKATGAKAGQDYAGAYEAEAKKILNAAWRSLPEPAPNVNLRKWDKALATVRAEMKDLSEQRIGIDIDQKTFDKAVDDFRRRLEALRDTATGVNKDRGFFDAGAAASQLGDLQKFTKDVTSQAEKAADQAGSAFNTRMNRVLTEGLSKLPPMKLTADSSQAERKLAGLQQRMETLQSLRIGVDIDAGAAYAELKAIHDELQSLDRRSVRVDIRTNAHEATAGMSAFIQQAEQAGTATESIGQRANFSLSRLEYLIALGASLGTSIVPAALAAAGAVGTLGTAAAAALSGVGVFALGISGVAEAVKALDGYQKDQAKSASSVDQAQRRVASSTDQVRSAQLSLANTRRTIAQQEQDAARRVADAERAVAEVRRSNARDLAEQARQVRDAQQAVTAAEKDAKEIRESLNEAIRSATRDMQELDVALSRNQVDQDKAVTAQMKALEELNKLKANPRATEIELRQAQDAYDEQTQQLVELRQKRKELAEDKARADKLGVEGDERVIAARKRIADADERTARAQENLARQRDQQREAEYQGQQRIAAAERQVADARRQQARQQQDAQFQLAQAANSVTQAQRSQQQAWEKSGLAGGEALQKLNEQMAELSPAAQTFAKFLFGLKDEVLGLRAAAAEPLLPDLQTAITLLLPYLPAVEKFVGKIASAMGDLSIKAVQALGDPVWQRFFGYIDKTAVPTLNMLYEVGQNVAQGLISLFLALTPFNDQVGTGLVDLSRDFAMWAERLDKSQGYQDFLDYVATNGPRVVHFLGEIGVLLVDLVRAAMPLGSLVLRGLTLLVDALNSIPQPALTALVFGIGAVALGMTTLGGIMRAIKFKQQMTDIFGPKVAQMVQTYAIDTDRATASTSAFGKATATASGMAAAAGTRLQGLGTSARNAAVAGVAPLASAMQAAKVRVAELGASASAAATGGLVKARLAMLEVAAAANGPGGLAAGATAAGGKIGGLAKSAGGAATTIGGKLVSGVGAATALLGPWGLALAGVTIAVSTLASASADYNGKIATLTSTLEELGGQYKELAAAGKLGTPDATQIITEIVKQNPEMRQAVLNLNSIGVSITQVGKAAAGSQQDLQSVLKALDEEIDATGAKWKDQSNFLLTVWSSDARATSDRLTQLRQLREAVKKSADENQLAAEVQKVLNGEDQRSIDIAAIKTAAQGRSLGVQSDLITAYDQNALKIRALNNLITVFSSAESTAATKAEAMRAAIEEQTGSVIDATEASESFRSKLIGLREQVNQAKDAHDKNATSMDLNSTTALRNRDAVEDVAKASRDMYIQDIAAGKPLSDVTKAHNDRITALREEAKRLNLTKGETDKLIAAYGKVPDDVSTVIKMDPNSFDAVYRNLQRMQFMQSMLKIGMDPAKAEQEWQDYQREIGRALKKAQGGPIVGPGTGTSDSVLMWGSDGEYVHRAAAVDYYGEGVMAAMNRKQIPREWFPGYRHGGKVVAPRGEDGLPRHAGGGRVTQTWPYDVNVKNTWVPDKAWLQANMAGADGGGEFVGLSPDASVRKIQQWALGQRGKRYLWGAVGPERYDCSGMVGNLWALATGHSLYRRYMSTADMGPGRHGMVAGPGKNMTVYLGPGHTAANVGGLHVEAYGGNGVPVAIGHIGTPLSYYNQRLHLPGFAEGGQINPRRLRTKRERMASFLLYGWPEPPTGGTFGNLLDSPLAARQFDSGGMLPPGYSTVVNGTGRPEPVLTDQQWRDISALTRGGDGASGATYNFEFRDTTLDPGKLRALQDREAVLARQGRAR